MRFLTLVGFLIGSIFSQIAVAESIQLKDGTIIKGSIATMDEQNVIIDTADMGRITIKRRNIQSIRDGVENPAGPKNDAPQNINININNNQNNDQKNEQKAEQKIEQKVQVDAQMGDEKKERTWEQGLFGRLSFGTQKVKISGAPESNSDLNADNTEFGLGWDVVGFRSASLWSAVLFFNGGTLDRVSGDNTRPLASDPRKLKTDLVSVGLRLDANIFKSSHGKSALSQFYIGPSISRQVLEVREDVEKQTPQKFSFRATGTRVGLDVGYEYLVGPNFGINLGMSAGQGELSSFEFGETSASDGYKAANFDQKKIKTTNVLVVLGLAWNVDI